MRTAPLLGLLIPAGCGASLALILVGCHEERRALPEAQAESSRTLKVEAYDAPIPKAPLSGGKLETLSRGAAPPPTPAAAPETTAASAAPPAALAVPVDKPVARAASRADPSRPSAGRVYADAYGADGPRRQPVPSWAADPRREPAYAEPPYADPAPRYETYSRAPYPRDDQDESALPGFRITLPVCRQAARQGDPLARTEACADMLQTAREQGRLCRQAFEDGDDRVALSPACRQSAQGR